MILIRDVNMISAVRNVSMNKECNREDLLSVIFSEIFLEEGMYNSLFNNDTFIINLFIFNYRQR